MLGRYGHLYPWQLATRYSSLSLTSKLARTYDVARLQQDCDSVIAHYGPETHFNTRHHDGGWTGVGLVTAGGDPFEDRKLPGGYEKTPALRIAPYIEELVDSFDCEKNRVRLLRLDVGSRVYWHNDSKLSLDLQIARLHIPIVTNDLAKMQISHVDCRWKPGELWYGDWSFPHRIRNDGRQARIHLVIDLVVNDFVRGLLPTGYHEQQPLRRRVRKHTNAWMDRLEWLRHHGWRPPSAWLRG